MVLERQSRIAIAVSLSKQDEMPSPKIQVNKLTSEALTANSSVVTEDTEYIDTDADGGWWELVDVNFAYMPQKTGNKIIT